MLRVNFVVVVVVRGVHGHLHGHMPWAHCDEVIDEHMAALVGQYPPVDHLSLHLSHHSYFRMTKHCLRLYHSLC